MKRIDRMQARKGRSGEVDRQEERFIALEPSNGEPFLVASLAREDNERLVSSRPGG
jgi:hypothetical protein